MMETIIIKYSKLIIVGNHQNFRQLYVFSVIDNVDKKKRFTKTVEVVILLPPAPPTTMRTSPFPSTIMDGHMDDNGRFPGLM